MMIRNLIFFSKVERLLPQFAKVISVMMTSCYVFNVNYNKYLRSTMMLLQKYFLEIPDSGIVVPIKVITLWLRLNKNSAAL